MAYSKKPADHAALDKLKSDLSAGRMERLYVFYGEEGYLKRYYLERLKALCAGPFSDFNTVVLDEGQVTAQALTDAIESLPMGGETKLIILRDYKLLQPVGDLKERLPALLADLPEGVCLVFVFETTEFKPDKRLKLYQLLEKTAQLVEFRQAQSQELIPWIKRHFYELGKTIDTQECEYLLFLCGGSMDNLLTEIEKIAAGTQKSRISQRDIDALGSRVPEADVFALTNCLMDGQYAKGLLILRDLLDMKNDPVMISALITKQMQRLYGAKLALAQNRSDSDIASLLGLKPYPTRLTIQRARGCSLAYLRRAQQLCLETDLALKSNLPDSRRTLELLLMRLREGQV